MSALPKPLIDNYPIPSKHYSPRRTRQKSLRRKVQQSQSRDLTFSQPTQETLQAETVKSDGKTSSPQTASFPQVQSLPVKLKVLLLLQKSSLGLAFVLIATSIVVYVSSVRIPELWSRQYQNLETLQRQERQLIAANESLKHELAQQAQQKDSNLTLITSNNTIFIPPASPSQPQTTNLKQERIKASPKDIPMGY